jgi:hypothetical protein
MYEIYYCQKIRIVEIYRFKAITVCSRTADCNKVHERVVLKWNVPLIMRQSLSEREVCNAQSSVGACANVLEIITSVDRGYGTV